MYIHLHTCTHRYLYGLESYERGKSKAKDSPGKGRKRAAAVIVDSEEETEDHRPEKSLRVETPEKPAKSETIERIEQRTTRLSKQTSKEARDLGKELKMHKDAPPSLLLSPLSSSPAGRGLKETGKEREREARDVKSLSRAAQSREIKTDGMDEAKSCEKVESPASITAECKSEPSDHESSQVSQERKYYHLCVIESTVCDGTLYVHVAHLNVHSSFTSTWM